MAQQRSPHRVSYTIGDSALARKKYSLRHSPVSRRAFALVKRIHRSSANSHASGASPPSSPINTALRPVLAALHPNLRRLPSRVYLDQKEGMRDVSQNVDVKAGIKRKRMITENALSSNRTTRGYGKAKRRKSVALELSSDDEDETSSMEMDISSHRWNVSDESEPGSDEDESSDEFLINEASQRQLLRLRKDELVRLFVAAGLADDAELMTKPEIVDAIISARDDLASLPPSSPGRGDGSSEYSSDDGNVAGGEETDVGKGFTRSPQANGLRRRATVLDGVGNSTGKFLKTRSLSLSQLNSYEHAGERSAVSGSIDDGSANSSSTLRRRVTRNGSMRSSPAPTSSSKALPSPPATRLRSRKVSAENSINGVSPPKCKGKAKQVEFSDQVQVQFSSSIAIASAEESELTDLAELEAKIAASTPSPRRLRSRDKGGGGRDSDRLREADEHDGTRINELKRRRSQASAKYERDESDQETSVNEDEEIDELVSSPSPSPSPPPPGRRTPVKRRLRARPLQGHAPSSDGDDEGDAEDEDEGKESEDIEDPDDVSEVSKEEEEDDVYEYDDAEVMVTPRKLRNGKVVGEEAQANEEDIEESTEEDEREDDDTEYVDDADDIDINIDVEGEEDAGDEDEAMLDDDIDLTIATAKTLVRLRRDDLVRLCESRDLDVAGTKPQLAKALLQWRDRQATEASSPSSSGTARPPSTVKRPNGRRRNKSTSTSPPVLLRSRRFHQDEPRTPRSGDEGKEAEADLELDLESLGLEDREIPPDKLTKLEKIGSGGFKDVYIGKFKGRRVAIAEFRDQLSAMDIKELKLLGGFDHPNIVRFLGVSITENPRDSPVMIVSELCSNGDLFDYIRNVPPPSLHKVLNIMVDIARGLEYLHTRKPSVIHRDCKSSNILITSRGTAKIADFGLAKVKQSTKSMVRSLVGTVNWQAPELWHAHPKYNHKVDVFSCAAVYWEMLQWHLPNKKFPWEGMNEHAIYELVGAKKQRPSLSGLRKQWCPEIVDLIERMWAHDHQDRPTMTEVVQELECLVAR